MDNVWINTIIPLAYAIAAVGSIFSAILAWIAKIRWSNEFAAAKDETIKAKESIITTKNEEIAFLDRQIKVLQDFSPDKLLKHYTSIKQQLENVNDDLQRELDKVNTELQEKSITEKESDVRIKQLFKEKKELEENFLDVSLGFTLLDENINSVSTLSSTAHEMRVRNNELHNLIVRFSPNSESVFVVEPYMKSFFGDKWEEISVETSKKEKESK